MADDATREDLVYQVKAEQGKTARTSRVHRASPVPAAGGGADAGRTIAASAAAPHAVPVAPGAATGFGSEAGDTEVEGPKKRRRRRRKPTGGGDAGSGPATAAG